MKTSKDKGRKSWSLGRLRRRAKALLRKSPRAVPPVSVKDAQHLRHELDVHHAELEMQNEELRRVQVELEDSRDHLARLYDLAPIGYLTLDAEAVICEANATAARLLGLERPGLLKKRFSRFVAAESRDDFDLYRQRVFTTSGRRSCELQMRRDDGAGFIGQLECVAETLAENQPPQGLMALSDVTERKRAEGAIRRSEQALTDFFAEAPIGLLWVAPDGRILRANRAQAAMLGCRDEDLLGRRWPEFCANPEVVSDMLERVARKESVRDHPLRLLRQDRSLLHVVIDANGLWENGKLVHSRWFVRDVTRRLELQKEILSVGERVQTRIGQDLHDDLCQQLTAIEFLGWALERRLAPDSPAEGARARELTRLTRQAIAHARELAHGMAPMELETGGLAEALENLAARVTKLFHVDCRFRGNFRGSVDDPEARIHLYRIAQESVNNAIKHGHAGRVQIGLAMDRSNIVLSVEDNGGGLPPKLPDNSFGLRIMEYRAGILGGSLAVRRRKPGGTIVVCSIPRAASRTAAQQNR